MCVLQLAAATARKRNFEHKLESTITTKIGVSIPTPSRAAGFYLTTHMAHLSGFWLCTSVPQLRCKHTHSSRFLLPAHYLLLRAIFVPVNGKPRLLIQRSVFLSLIINLQYQFCKNHNIRNIEHHRIIAHQYVAFRIIITSNVKSLVEMSR